MIKNRCGRKSKFTDLQGETPDASASRGKIKKGNIKMVGWASDQRSERADAILMSVHAIPECPARSPFTGSISWSPLPDRQSLVSSLKNREREQKSLEGWESSLAMHRINVEHFFPLYLDIYIAKDCLGSRGPPQAQICGNFIHNWHETRLYFII